MQRLPRFVAQQIHYTLEAREAEYELLPIAIDQGVASWSGGRSHPAFSQEYSADKSHRNGVAQMPTGAVRRSATRSVSGRLSISSKTWRRSTMLQWHISRFPWVLGRPGVASVVVGGLTENHFRENIAAIDVKLNAHDMARLNDISRLPNLYPYWHHRRSPRIASVRPIGPCTRITSGKASRRANEKGARRSIIRPYADSAAKPKYAASSALPSARSSGVPSSATLPLRIT